MAIEIIEAFCEGKFQDARNEDRIFTSDKYLAVIDGSSAAQPIRGRAGGVIAAEVIVSVLDTLPADATIHSFVRSATEALSAIAASSAAASPYAAAVVYSSNRREVWRIGDCPFALDGLWNIPDHNPHETTFFNFRRMVACGHAGMATVHGGALIDVGLPKELVVEWLAMTKSWVNAHDNPYAFAALDERLPPARFLEVFTVADSVRDVTLASDGAVVSPAGQRGPSSAQEMLAQIANLKLEDPLCLRRFSYWRGFLPGSTYLDDTTILRVRLDG